jgi:oligopeptide/dipeptide ABC transporter ATP-binding protein
VEQNLLDIQDLAIDFHTPEGVGRAVDSMSLSIAQGETLGLVGESGCGKSVTSLSVLGLIPSPPGRIHSGQILFDGKDLRSMGESQLRSIRGRDISMIFQEPMTSLNPVLPIGRQVAEPLMVHLKISKQEALEKAARWLDRVKIPAPEKRLKEYPHQLSGGMRQRVMIAMAMVCRPKLLIADEPTTALDVSIQSQILSLMEGLRREIGMSLLLITHDLGVVAQMASRVVVMYAGQVVEVAGLQDLFEQPFHPYTKGLLKSIPRLGSRAARRKKRLDEIKGTVPSLLEPVEGCKFADRCPQVFGICRERPPALEFIGDGHQARCWLTQPEFESLQRKGQHA